MAQRVAEFFSNEVTHFITNKPISETDEEANKENSERPKIPGMVTTLRSPIKLRGLYVLPLHNLLPLQLMFCSVKVMTCRLLTIRSFVRLAGLE